MSTAVMTIIAALKGMVKLDQSTFHEALDAAADQHAAEQNEIQALREQVANLAPQDLSSIQQSVAALQAKVDALGAPFDPTAINAEIAALQTDVAALKASAASDDSSAGALDALEITTTTFPDATVGVPYVAEVSGIGGQAPVTLAATGLPDGLSMDATGAISGTPTTVGTSEVVITATDATTPTALTVGATIPLNVVAAP